MRWLSIYRDERRFSRVNLQVIILLPVLRYHNLQYENNSINRNILFPNFPFLCLFLTGIEADSVVPGLQQAHRQPHPHRPSEGLAQAPVQFPSSRVELELI